MASKTKTVLVTGANGYIGNAVAHAFARAGYLTLGVIRKETDSADLTSQGIQPLIGSAANHKALVEACALHTKTLDVIVSTTEQWPDYETHFKETVSLIKALADVSNSAGTRPLVIFTSGCKDYGTGPLHGTPGLEAHTESTPLNPPQMLSPRTINAPKIFDYSDSFDAIVTRPTNVHGRSSSFYGLMIELALRAKEEGIQLVFPGDPNTIAHSVHVDDCGEAYVALAEHPNRGDVAGQVFNMSAGQRYETMQQIADAATKTIGLEHPIKCIPSPAADTITAMFFNWSQWVGSEKIRELTGWKDARPMFAEDLDLYVKEYKEAKEGNDSTYTKMLGGFGEVLEALLQEQRK